MKITSKWRWPQNEDNLKRRNKRLNDQLLSYQTKTTKPFLPDQTYHTKPTQNNLPNQTLEVLENNLNKYTRKSRVTRSLPWAWHSWAPASSLSIFISYLIFPTNVQLATENRGQSVKNQDFAALFEIKFSSFYSQLVSLRIKYKYI